MLLVGRLAPQYRSGIIASLFATVVAWTVFPVLALAPQSGVSDPWMFNPSSRASHDYLYYPINILNILTDGLLAIFILPIIWKLNMAKPRRLTTMISFATRTGCIPLSKFLRTATSHRDQRLRDGSLATSGIGTLLSLLRPGLYVAIDF